MYLARSRDDGSSTRMAKASRAHALTYIFFSSLAVVALKSLDVSLEQNLATVEHEIRMMRSCEHVNIVKCVPLRCALFVLLTRRPGITVPTCGRARCGCAWSTWTAAA